MAFDLRPRRGDDVIWITFPPPMSHIETVPAHGAQIRGGTALALEQAVQNDQRLPKTRYPDRSITVLLRHERSQL